MPRGRKPKPTYLRLLQGNRENRPINQNEPQPRQELPPPPEILSEDGKIEWARIAEEVYNLGLLTIVDVQTLAAYCQSYSRWVTAERALARVAALDPQTSGLVIRSQAGNPIVNPLVWVSRSAVAEMVKYASEFGFTPASRTRIAIGKSPEAQDKFQGLLG